AIPALRDVLFDPCGLYRMHRAGLQTFDRRDSSLPDRGRGRHARAHCHTIEMDSARAAEPSSTPELGAGEPQLVAKNPQKRHIVSDVDRARLSVNGQDQLRHGVDTWTCTRAIWFYIESMRAVSPITSG